MESTVRKAETNTFSNETKMTERNPEIENPKSSLSVGFVTEDISNLQLLSSVAATIGIDSKASTAQSSSKQLKPILHSTSSIVQESPKLVTGITPTSSQSLKIPHSDGHSIKKEHQTTSPTNTKHQIISKQMLDRIILLGEVYHYYFELGEEIGKGDTGRVYAAIVDIAFRNLIKMVPSKIAIKILPVKNKIEKYDAQREYAIQKLFVNSPNITTVYGRYGYENSEHIVMEHCEGGNVAKAVAEYGRLSELQVLKVMKGVFSALQVIHNCGLVHMNVHPENILLSQRFNSEQDTLPNALLCDFGSSLLCREALDFKYLSPGYVPPELLSGKLLHAASSMDIWSAGITFFELLTGLPPYVCISIEDQIEKMRTFEITVNSLKRYRFISQDTITFAISCLNRDPEKRPSADSMFMNVSYHLWRMEVEHRKEKE